MHRDRTGRALAHPSISIASAPVTGSWFAAALAGGSFVIGDLNAAVGTSVTLMTRLAAASSRSTGHDSSREAGKRVQVDVLERTHTGR
jgi:hypothetical protein